MTDAENVKSKLDIVEVIMGYVELKKAGKDYKGVSPFRQERTPSFFVSPEKQIWHDFGANEGGDLISFIMQIEGMTFPEALTLLADRAGVKLQKQSHQHSSSNTAHLKEAVKKAMSYYHLNLSKNTTALQYIKDTRGLTAETIKRFVVGYAPDGWTGLADYLVRAGFSESELVSAGLAGKRQKKSGVYDLFRDRVVFPVFNRSGEPIGFSGRILDGNKSTAKYINTPDCEVYHKSEAIFGYHQAKDAIRKTKQVVIVEGHLDVLSLSQHGRENVVAVSGTALTLQQLTILSQMADVIQLCFDQDAAGRKATYKSIELAAANKTKIKAKIEVVSFKGAKDPDELIRQDPKTWDAALKKAEYGIDYIFRDLLEQYPVEKEFDKQKFLSLALPFFGMISDSLEKENYIEKTARALGASRDELRKLVGQQKAPEAQSQSQPNSHKSVVTPAKRTRLEQLEEPLLEMMLAHPKLRVAVQDINPSDLSDSNRDFFKLLIKSPTITLDEIQKILPDQGERAKILALRGDHEYSAMTEHEIGLEAFTQVHTVQKHITDIKKRELTRAIAKAEQSDDMKLAGELLKRYQQLVDDDAIY